MNFSHQHADTVLTFDNFIKLRRQIHPEKHFIYVHVAVLKEGDVFVRINTVIFNTITGDFGVVKTAGIYYRKS